MGLKERVEKLIERLKEPLSDLGWSLNKIRRDDYIEFTKHFEHDIKGTCGIKINEQYIIFVILEKDGKRIRGYKIKTIPAAAKTHVFRLISFAEYFYDDYEG